jgi:hypothetical protein
MMAKASEADRVAGLEHRLVFLEAFVDSEHRERMGLTLDDIRAFWRTDATRRKPRLGIGSPESN